MAINIDTLFTQLGRLAGLLKITAAHQTDLVTGVANAVTAFAALPAPVALLAPASQLPATAAGQFLANRTLEAFVVDAAQKCLLATVAADRPERAWTVAEAAAEVARQMAAGSKSVKACTVSATAAAVPAVPYPVAGNAGDGTLVTTVRQPSYANSENAFAETLTVGVSDDGTAGAEVWAVVGAAAATGAWNRDWPAGSAAVGSLTTCDPAAASGQSLLTDGSFEAWTDAATPADWTATGVVARQAVPFDALAGTTRYSISPATGSVTVAQTVTGVQPQTAYALGFQTRLNVTTGFTSGTVQIELYDVLAGTVINDLGGNPLRVSFAYTADTTWHANYGAVVTPRALPKVVGVRVVWSTTYTGSGYPLVDFAALWPLAYPYPGSPGLGIVRGANDFKAGDGFTVAVANNRGGATSGYTWQAVFDRFFGTRAAGVYLPTAASPTEADSLITAS